MTSSLKLLNGKENRKKERMKRMYIDSGILIAATICENYFYPLR